MVSRTSLLKKPLFYIFFILFVLWIILFEFILPENGFLPKPGIVLLTIPALFEDYHLLANFFTTVSAVYLPLLLSYLFLFLFRQWIFSGSGSKHLEKKWISVLVYFIPAIPAGLFLVFWFPHSFYPEYLFSFIISTSWWLIRAGEQVSRLNANYSTAFRSFGADDRFISKHIIWFEVLPGIFSKLPGFHIHLWGLILIFEFIMNYYGMGAILRQILLFHDLSALFLLTIIISVITAAGYALIRTFEDKFIFWSAE